MRRKHQHCSGMRPLAYLWSMVLGWLFGCFSDRSQSRAIESKWRFWLVRKTRDILDVCHLFGFSSHDTTNRGPWFDERSRNVTSSFKTQLQLMHLSNTSPIFVPTTFWFLTVRVLICTEEKQYDIETYDHTYEDDL